MAFKFRVKLGPVEVEYEGDQEFDEKKLLGLVTEIVHIHESSGKKVVTGAGATHEEPGKGTGKGSAFQMTTLEIASKLKLGKGSNLLVAACAHLEFVKGKQSCTKDEIFAESKTATGFYKATLQGNLTKYFRALGDKLNVVGTDTYTLNDETRADLKGKLGIS